MSHPLHNEIAPEDVPLFAALAALEGGSTLEGESGEAAGDPEAEAQERVYLELLGLLPVALEPVAPPAGVRQRIFAELGIAEPAAAPQPVRAVPAPPLPWKAPLASRPPLAARRWPMALAAALSAVFLGTSLFLYNGMREESGRADQMAQQLEQERERAERSANDAKAVRTHLAEMRDRVGVVTSPAVLVSTLRPMGEPPLQPQAGGVLFVQSDHQHWYLSLRDLQPPGDGHCYQVWFVSDTGMVSAGTLHPGAGKPMEMGSSTMPKGTQGVMVTLEPAAGAATPTGPEVLRGMPFQTL